jgi:hypothetical protein
MNPVLERQLEEAGRVMARTGDAPEEGTDYPRLSLVRQDALVAKNTPLPPPVIDGLISQGEIALLAAEPKAGKSWFLLQAANSIGAGVPFLGFPTVQGPVVYVNTEVSDAAWENRCRWMEAGIGVSSPQVWHVSTRGQPLAMANLLPALKSAIAGAGLSRVALVVLDPWYTLAAGLDECAAGDVATVMLRLQSLAEELGAAVWIAHHFTKGDSAAKAMKDRASGSGAFLRAVDDFMTLTTNADGEIVLEVIRRSAKTPGPLALEFDFPVWKSLGTTAPVAKPGRKPTYTVQSLCNAFRTNDETLRRADFIERGIGRGSIGRLIEEGLAGGHLVRDGTGYRLGARVNALGEIEHEIPDGEN